MAKTIEIRNSFDRKEREIRLTRKAGRLLFAFAVSTWQQKYSIPADAMDQGQFSHRPDVQTLSATSAAQVVRGALPLFLSEAIYRKGAPLFMGWPREHRLVAVDPNQPRLDPWSASLALPTSIVAIFRDECVYDKKMSQLEERQLDELGEVLKAMEAFYNGKNEPITLDTLRIPDVGF